MKLIGVLNFRLYTDKQPSHFAGLDEVRMLMMYAYLFQAHEWLTVEQWRNVNAWCG